ncbi:elongator complex protein 2 [Anabrus simplex]|uniref:elongator complex protein 2 n=1 Tax=Anabrus simplex TaxID=316456 RepID=UPI0035A30D6A
MTDMVKTIYTSCSCNHGPHTADWGRNGLILYGVCNAVALYDIKFADAGKILSTFCHHKRRVTSVRWVRDHNGSEEKEFISTSLDRTAVVWSLEGGLKYHPSAVLTGHRENVKVADGIYVSEKSSSTARRSLIVVTASVDCSVKIWKRNENEDSFTNEQTLNFGRATILCTRLHFLPHSRSILLACASDDSKIHLFAAESSDFVKVDCLVGHKDFVWAVDITATDSGDLLLASASQDCTIRLWRLSICEEPSTHSSVGNMVPEKAIKLENRVFYAGGCFYAVEMDAVLTGHEGGVYGINWAPAKFSESGEKLEQPMMFLSSSMDKLAIVWRLNKTSHTWEDTVYLGEDASEMQLGFSGGKFGPDGLSVLIHGFHGSLHMWDFHPESGHWKPLVPVGGHFDEVRDIQWEPHGTFLMSVSKDQTTRIHAPWVRPENCESTTWHELARPQVHGYDLTSIAVFSNYTFASGAEEKLVRVFKAPKYFHGNISRLCQVNSPFVGEDGGSLPFGAISPALGLSNKAVSGPGDMEVCQSKPRKPCTVKCVYVDFREPPTEEVLQQNTLWPEIRKLYGHGFEIYALAAHPSGKYLASACKATRAEFAGIVIWNAETWKQHQMLMSHVLTVTQLEFSPDGQYLLSVSRDRRWSLFRLVNSVQGDSFELVVSTDQDNGVHGRIIWTCSWSHDSQYFATGSREGKVVIWPCSIGPPVCSSLVELKGQSVTAVAFAPSFIADKYVLAVGLECGTISIYTWHPDSKEWSELIQLDNDIAHHLAVKRLTFRPTDSSVLASCGSDRLVKIYDLSPLYI